MRLGVIPCIVAIFLLLAAGGAGAQERGGPSLDRILPQIRERHPGKFYDAEGPWRGPDGGLRYRLKWMTPDGRIVWFDADARTGRVLGPDFGARDFMRGPGRFRDDDAGFFPDRGRRWYRGGRWPGGPRGGAPHFRGRGR